MFDSLKRAANIGTFKLIQRNVINIELYQLTDLIEKSSNFYGAKNNDSLSEKWAMAIFYTMEY